MNVHEFTFLVSGVDPHAEDFADRFFEAGCDDATLMLTHGLVAVNFAREGENFSQAVLSAFRDILKTGATIERFEPDFLVSKAEIARRASLSRAAISLYVSGERGVNFPAPKARITSNSPLWDWVEVSSWLHRHEHPSLDVVLAARVSRVVNTFVFRNREHMRVPEKSLFRHMEDMSRELEPA